VRLPPDTFVTLWISQRTAAHREAWAEGRLTHTKRCSRLPQGKRFIRCSISTRSTNGRSWGSKADLWQSTDVS
jgi:hypothetical protein